MRLPTTATLVALCVAMPWGGALAQGQKPGAWPTKPVRLLIPTSPGGSLDIVSRLMAQRLAETLGQQVVADNRPGASAIVATEALSRAAPDGYTLMMGYSSHVANPSLYAKLPYDTLKDVQPVSQVVSMVQMMVAHPSLPARTARELIALAKSRPGELSYASPGIGAAAHLSAELFKSMAGVKIQHIPYKGGAPAVMDLIGGQVTLMFNGMPVTLPHIRSGKLRALAVSTAKRSPVMPDVPALSESVPGYDVAEWNGLFAPAGTPAAVVARLQGDVARVLQAAEVRERLSGQGADPVGSSADEFSGFVRSEITKWAKVVREGGIRVEQ